MTTKTLVHLLLSIIGSLFAWTIIDKFIVTVNIFQYLFIEFFLTGMHYLYKFAIRNL
jgi:hypothetical protein